MRTIGQALAWKEWHEHKWKLAALTTVLCGVNALILFNIHYDMPQDLFDVAYAMSSCCTIPFSLFIGASVAAGERSRGTAPFLQAIPVSPPVVAMFKLLAGLATVIACTVLAFAFVYLGARILGYDLRVPSFYSDFGLSPLIGSRNWFINRAILVSLIASSVYLWTAAAGVNRQDEISAAARAALAMIVWWVALVTVSQWFDPQWLRKDGWWIVWMCQSSSPGGTAVVQIPQFAPLKGALLGIPWPIAFGLLFHFGLAYWYVSRFGQTGTTGIRSLRKALMPAARCDWLGPPRQSPLTAIAWKQSRESGPLVLIGLAGIMAILGIVCVVNWHDFSAELALRAYYGLTYGMGLLVTLVVGIGVMLFDLSPKLNTFWRSRPISPDLWYWTKVATGLVVIFASLYLPLAVVALLERGTIFMEASAYEAVLFPATMIGIFIAAVMTTCLVRHAIYAAVLSISAIYLSFFAILGSERVFTMPWNEITMRNFSDGEVAMSLVASIITFAIVGWLAVRNDWGRKSRY
jgi:hypothetical protein